MTSPIVHPSPDFSRPMSQASSIKEPAQRTLSIDHTPSSIPQQKADRQYHDANHQSPFDVSPARRWTLLVVMSLAIALDVVNVSALLTATNSIVQTVHLEAGNIIWVIGAYSMTFASFMLFFGRVSDLYPAQYLFEAGLGLLGILMLVASFVSNQYGFLVIRGIQGICGAATIPSAYHLIVHLFTDKAQQQMALATLGLSGAVANSIGVILGGVFELASWRWLFRFLAIIAILAAVVAIVLMPNTETTKNESQYTKFQQLDLIGVFLMVACLLLFILGLTSGTVKGWTSANFLAPFLLSVVLFPAFFLWERHLPDDRAVLPIGVWRLPNLPLLAFAALSPYMFWATTQFGFANYWQVVDGTTAILAAARLLPEGISALIGGGVVQGIPSLLSKPKWTMVGGQLLAVVGMVLMIVSQGGHGTDYWKFVFTGMAIGSFGIILAFLALNVAIVQAVPPTASGVAGALLQTALQIGGVIGLSVQAGLYSQVGYDLSDWHGSQYGYFFLLGWFAITGIAVAVFFRPERSVEALQKVQSRVEGDVPRSDREEKAEEVKPAETV